MQRVVVLPINIFTIVILRYDDRGIKIERHVIFWQSRRIFDTRVIRSFKQIFLNEQSAFQTEFIKDESLGCKAVYILILQKKAVSTE